MLPESSALLALVALVDRIPLPDPPRRRGRPTVYSERLFLKALIVMILRRLPRVHSLLAVLDEPTPEMRRLRALLTDERGRFPSRRTWERRLAAVPAGFARYYNVDRPHRTLALETPRAAARPHAGPVRARPVLGGLHHVYERTA
jgi:hypothetical protein